MHEERGIALSRDKIWLHLNINIILLILSHNRVKCFECMLTIYKNYFFIKCENIYNEREGTEIYKCYIK